MKPQLVALVGWTVAVICAVGWAWQWARTQQGQAAIAKGLERVEELANGLRCALQERDQAFQRGRDREEAAKKFGHEGVVRDVLPLIDDFERASHPALANDPKGILEGVQMIRRQFLETLRRHGVEDFDATGRPFDPRQHEAVDQVPSAEVPPGTVVQQVSRGFLLHGRLLQAARVVVSVEPPEGLELDLEEVEEE